MRQVITRMLPALLVVLAFSAVTASGAFAASKKGEIVNEKGAALVKSHFTGGTEIVELNTGTGTVITCRSSVSNLSGAITSTTAGTATLTLTGCTHGFVCKTVSAKNRGEWILPLKLTVIAKEEVDQVVAEVPETALTCEGTESKVRGSFLFSAGEGVLSTKSGFASNGLLPATNPLQFKFGGASHAWESLKIYGSFEETFEEKMELI